MDELISIHDTLYNLADSCIYEVINYNELKDKKNMLIISVIEEARFKTFISELFEINPDINITVIVQDYVYEGFLKSFGEDCKVISWHGNYSLEILDRISTIVNIKEIDAFVYFSDFQMNLRDSNFWEIAVELDKINRCKAYCCTIGNDIYGYKNSAFYKQILMVYEDITQLIKLYLEDASCEEVEMLNENRNIVAK